MQYLGVDVHDIYLVHLAIVFLLKLLYQRNQYILCTYIHLSFNMVRRMKAIITQIESVVTPSGNSGHVVVPKAWIGKEAIVTLKENRGKGKK
jgi:putative transposon-encoded protein